MKPNISELFDLTMNNLEESDFRFFINRSRSVVIIHGSEFNNDIVPNDTDIYVLYNDPDNTPLLVSFTTGGDEKVKDYSHSGYFISYITKEGKSVTYLREDALAFLEKDDIMAASKINEPLGQDINEISKKYKTDIV